MRVTTESNTSAEREGEEAPSTDHLDGVADGCGCAEVWEHLSEQRDGED